MQISVLSGKGGTGKTTIAVNLAVLLKDSCYIDCDVEEPNGHIFLNPEYSKSERVEVMVPAIDKEKCSGCGECVRFCYFNALALVNKKVLLFPEICHSCGGCIHVCPENAVTEGKKDIGRIDKGWGEGIECVRGVLEIGEPVGVPIIKEIKSGLDETKVNILDCPPGSSCTVVNSIQGCDYALLVTEPTRSGLEDLKRALLVCDHFGINAYVCINKHDLNEKVSGEIEGYCTQKGYGIVGRVPYDAKVLEALKALKPVVLFKESPAAAAIEQMYVKVVKLI